jgi:hypothetical protein
MSSMSNKLKVLTRFLKSRECVFFVRCELRLNLQLRIALLWPNSITKAVSHIVLPPIAQNRHIWPNSLVTLVLLIVL